MAAPSGTTLSVDEVFITPSNKLTYQSSTPDCSTGTIEALGSGVTGYVVGDLVFYKSSYPFGNGVDTWEVVNKSNILFKINPV